MPGDSGATVVTNSYAFSILHMRLREQWAPGIPHALYLSRANRIMHDSDAIAPREQVALTIRLTCAKLAPKQDLSPGGRPHAPRGRHPVPHRKRRGNAHGRTAAPVLAAGAALGRIARS